MPAVMAVALATAAQAMLPTALIATAAQGIVSTALTVAAANWTLSTAAAPKSIHTPGVDDRASHKLPLVTNKEGKAAPLKD